MMGGLFQTGDFTLASGAKSTWKIECDALERADWDGLAHMLLDHVGTFSAVKGVPRGGLLLAECLEPFATQGPLLIVDDVWTTGGSMQRFQDTLADRRLVRRAVVFARNQVPDDVVALFQMPRSINHGNRLRELLEQFEAVQRGFAYAGANDTEPSFVWQRLVLDAALGREVSIPEEALTWQLYSTVSAHTLDKAVAALSAAATRVITFLQGLTNEQRLQLLNQHLETYCWRLI